MLWKFTCTGYMIIAKLKSMALLCPVNLMGGLYDTLSRYCKRIYDPSGPTSNVFLTLLRIYLRPTQYSSTKDLLPPALDLISRHSPRLDSVKTLELLPPLVTAKDVRAFLIEALRAPIFDRRVVKNISNARDDEVARKLMVLQSKRVKVTDSRMYVSLLRCFYPVTEVFARCPQCHKRIGHSVIVVHAPRYVHLPSNQITDSIVTLVGK